LAKSHASPIVVNELCSSCWRRSHATFYLSGADRESYSQLKGYRVDERARDLEQGHQAGADSNDQPQPRLSGPAAGAPPEGSGEPCRSTPFPPPGILPRAAGGGAGGVVALVLLAPEPARGEIASAVPSPSEPPPPSEPQAEPEGPAAIVDPPVELLSPPDELANDLGSPPEPEAEPEEPAAIVEPPIELLPPPGELASDPVPPPDAPPPEAPAELPGPVEATAKPVLIEDIPSAAFGPLSIPSPSPEVVPALRPIGPDHDQSAEPAEQSSRLRELPDLPHTDESATSVVAPPQPPDATVGDYIPQLEAPEPEIAATSEPALLDQIPSVQSIQPPPIAPGPVIVPLLRRIEPDHVARADSQPQRSPGVVLPVEAERIVPPSPLVALPLPARDATRTLGRRLRLALVAALAVAAVLAALVLALATLYRWVDPPMSTLMLGQRLAGMPVNQRWVPLERISPNLGAAVIQSEDGHFCRHHGVDWGELKEAIDSAGDGLARGGSTITMQVVKNLFLWPSRSYVRKAVEIPLAFVIEALWPKRRILEIYLNIAEWGPGVFGAEAAARYHFRKPARLLTPREAALLAVSLPNPIERQAGRPGPGTQRLADNLQLRMRAASANTRCLRATSGRG